MNERDRKLRAWRLAQAEREYNDLQVCLEMMRWWRREAERCVVRLEAARNLAYGLALDEGDEWLPTNRSA